jgi:hypothetical protein
MAQVFLLEQDQEIANILHKSLEAQFDLSVCRFKSSAEIIAMLGLVTDVIFIIVDDKSADTVCEAIISSNKQMPLYVIGNWQAKENSFVVARNKDWWTDLLSQIKNKFPQKNQKNDGDVKPLYVPMTIDFFCTSQAKILNADVFVKIKKSEDEVHYIKRLHKGEILDVSEIEKYKLAGVREFYLIKGDFNKIVGNLTKNLGNLLDHQGLKGEKAQEIIKKSYALTRDKLLAVGLDEDAEALVSKAVTKLNEEIGENQTLANYLAMIKRDTDSFGYNHTLLTLMIINKIILRFDWDSPLTRLKFTYLCFFHDISLQEDIFTKVHSDEDIERMKLKKETVHLIMNHAKESGDILDKFKEIPLGLSHIVREHHGSRNGFGFPPSFSAQLSPMSMVFITTEDFVLKYLSLETVSREGLEKIFIEMEKKFDRLTFAQTVMAIRHMTLGK